MLRPLSLSSVVAALALAALACNKAPPAEPQAAVPPAQVVETPPAAVPAAATTTTEEPKAEGAACPHAGTSACVHGEPTADTSIPAAAGPALTIPGTTYGAGVTVAEATPISKVSAESDTFVGKRVRIEGLVTDVCAAKGCWIRVASDKEFETLQIKVDDGVIVFPVSVKGQYVVAEGIVRKIPLTLEQTQKVAAREAEESGNTAFDPKTITEAKTIVRLQGLGAVIREKK
jgi:hypothetical protein